MKKTTHDKIRRYRAIIPEVFSNSIMSLKQL